MATSTRQHVPQPPPSLSVPATENRLFLGGLTTAISTAALQTLLQPFGTTTCIERNTDRGYAHVTLMPRDDGSFARCTAVLNGTQWCNSLLRVERAKPHFWHRLMDDWTRGDRKDLERESDDKKNQTLNNARVPRFSWKGKRIQFAEDEDEDEDKDSACEVNVAEETEAKAQEKKEEMASRAEGTKSTTTKTRRKRSTSAALSTTLQLFGLGDSDARDDDDDDDDDTAPLDRMTGSTAREEEKEDTSDARKKRKRKRGGDREEVGGMMNLAQAEAVGGDVSLINLRAEQSAALSILDAMFPCGGDNAETGMEQWRCKGLYRTLGEQGGVGSAVRRGTKEGSVAVGGMEEAGGRVERKGLYKRLRVM